MCFSARASFSAAALLLPLGAVAVRHVLRQRDDARLPLALTPLLFGLQQATEGAVWLGMAADPSPLAAALLPLASVTYLFFAYGLWPGWIGFIALRLHGAEAGPAERRWLAGTMAVGALFGLLLWLPLLLDPPGAIPTLVRGSLDYPVPPLLPGSAGRLVGQSLYAALIALPLILPAGELRPFGLTVLLAFVLAQAVHAPAFASVWCFFSALLSLQIVWIVTHPRWLPEPEAREAEA